MTGFKLKSASLFPSRVTGGLAMDVEKANGNYTIAVDYTNLAVVNPYTPVATDYVLVWDGLANNYFLVSATTLVAFARGLSIITDQFGNPITDQHGNPLMG